MNKFVACNNNKSSIWICFSWPFIFFNNHQIVAFCGVNNSCCCAIIAHSSKPTRNVI